MENKPILELKGITKKFVGTTALDNVSINLYPGKVMALVGENGAGKSTLVKIMSGIIQPTDGKIYINNKQVYLRNVHDASTYGIAVVHQELKQVDDLSIAENIFLNREPKTKMGLINYKRMNIEAKYYLEKLGLILNPTTLLNGLSISQKQMVEIAKACSKKAKIILFDEPTDTLTIQESAKLFKVIEQLKKQKVAMLYISHHMEEIHKIAEDVTIFRDGQFILQKSTKDIQKTEIINQMIGRTLNDYYPKRFKMKQGNSFEIKNLFADKIFDFNLKAYQYEILGIFGLMGAMRTEALEAVIGYKLKNSGSIFFDGKELKIKSVNDAIKNKIFYLSEDRKQKGLHLDWSIKSNITLGNINDILNCQVISFSDENKISQHYNDLIGVKSTSINQLVSNLSGGNQQKVLLAKALHTKPKVLIVDEPTRGIDIGAKKEIYNLLFELKKQGVIIIIISSDLLEQFNISDQIMVMSKGRVKGLVNPLKSTQADVMKLAVS